MSDERKQGDDESPHGQTKPRQTKEEKDQEQKIMLIYLLASGDRKKIDKISSTLDIKVSDESLITIFNKFMLTGHEFVDHNYRFASRRSVTREEIVVDCKSHIHISSDDVTNFETTNFETREDYIKRLIIGHEDFISGKYTYTYSIESLINILDTIPELRPCSSIILSYFENPRFHVHVMKERNERYIDPDEGGGEITVGFDTGPYIPVNTPVAVDNNISARIFDDAPEDESVYDQ